MTEWKKPSRFDANVIVIGAGSAGLISAYIAAASKARVVLVERDKMGGDCLNNGCVPSKALIAAAHVAGQARRAADLGLKRVSVEFEFSEIMDAVRDKIAKIEPHDSVERYTKLGVECVSGEARITSPWSVAVHSEIITARNIIIAAGARPLVPPLPGLENIAYRTSNNLWEMRELPRRLAVLGGGAIGCELSQAFARLGAEVTQIEMLPRLLSKEEPEASELITTALEADGVRVMTNTRVSAIENVGEEKVLICDDRAGGQRIAFDELLVAVGRKPNVEGWGLEELGIKLADQGAIHVDPFLRTSCPNIFACGDITGRYLFTHAAAHEAWHVAMNALFGTFWKFKVDYTALPWVTFTDPEVARIGLSEQEARDLNVPYEVTLFPNSELDRAVTDSHEAGFVKILTERGRDRLIGATVVGPRAGESIAELSLAMRHRLGLNKILGTTHAYPTYAEGLKLASGAWKRAHLPDWLFPWLERFHQWRRG